MQSILLFFNMPTIPTVLYTTVSSIQRLAREHYEWMLFEFHELFSPRLQFICSQQFNIQLSTKGQRVTVQCMQSWNIYEKCLLKWAEDTASLPNIYSLEYQGCYSFIIRERVKLCECTWRSIILNESVGGLKAISAQHKLLCAGASENQFFATYRRRRAQSNTRCSPCSLAYFSSCLLILAAV